MQKFPTKNPGIRARVLGALTDKPQLIADVRAAARADWQDAAREIGVLVSMGDAVQVNQRSTQTGRIVPHYVAAPYVLKERAEADEDLRVRGMIDAAFACNDAMWFDLDDLERLGRWAGTGLRHSAEFTAAKRVRIAAWLVLYRLCNGDAAKCDLPVSLVDDTGEVNGTAAGASIKMPSSEDIKHGRLIAGLYARRLLKVAEIPLWEARTDGSGLGVLVSFYDGQWHIRWHAGYPGHDTPPLSAAAHFFDRPRALLQDAGYEVNVQPFSAPPIKEEPKSAPMSPPASKQAKLSPTTGAVLYELRTAGPLGLTWYEEIVPRLEKAGYSYDQHYGWLRIMNELTRASIRVVGERGKDLSPRLVLLDHPATSTATI